MALRNEGVRVFLQDDYSTGMAKIAATTALANRELRDLDGASSRAAPSLSRVASEANRVPPALDRTGASAGRASSEIDTLSGRLGLLGKAALAVGPAILPIASVGVPALASLANVLGVTGLAVGTTMLAFKGLGDTMKALNDAQMDPTAEKIAKAKAQLDAIGPSAAQFALELDALEPQLDKIQAAAGKEMFPGLVKGLEDGKVVLPQIRGLFKAVGGAVGDLGEMTGKSLASGKWNDFLSFLREQAPPTIEAVGTAAGSVAHGLSELWMAFTPTNNDITSGLVDATKFFDQWASGLDQTQGFQEFIAYLQSAGPQVGSSLAAVGNALLQVVEAAAPLGGPVLTIVESFADAIAAIADSPIGAPLLAITSAVSALSLLNKGLVKTQGMMAGGLFGGAASADGAGAGGIGSFFQDNADQIKESVGQIKTNVGTIGAVMGTAGARTERESRRMSLALRNVASASMRVVGAAGRMALPFAGLALSATDVDDKMGLSNTAMLGLMGTMAGPWGAAVGAGVGLLVDLKKQSGEAGKAQADLEAVFRSSSSGIKDYVTGLQAAYDARSNMVSDENDITSPTDAVSDVTTFWGNVLSGKGRSQVDDLMKVTKPAQAEVNALATALYAVNDAAGGPAVKAGSTPNGLMNTLANYDEMTRIATEAAPAMTKLGISLQDLSSADPETLQGYVTSIVGFQASADSAEGKALSLAEAFNDLDYGLASTAANAEKVKNALDILLSPQLSLSAATDQWRDSLRNVKDALADNGRSLKGNTDDASRNREAIRGQVSNLQGLVNAQASSGATGKVLARTMRDGRKAILDAGAAAGLSRGQVRDYLNTLGLTPKTIRTLLNADTSQASNNVSGLKAQMDALRDKTIRITTITTRQGGTASTVEPHASIPKSGDGSTVPKTGRGYADRHLYVLADGEEVVSNRRGQADEFRPALKGINAGLSRIAVKALLADGGTTGDADEDAKDAARTEKQRAAARKKAASRAKARSKARSAYADLDVDTSLHDGVSEAADRFADEVDHVRSLFKDAGLQLTKAQKHQLDGLRGSARELDRLTAAVKTTRDAQAAYSQQVAGSIDHDIFGNGLAGAQAQLDADTNDNNAMLAALAQAVSQGFDGAALQALAASGDLTTAQQLAAGGSGVIGSFEASYGNRVASQQGLGAYAGQQVYGAEVRTQTAEVVKQTRAIERMEKAIGRMGGEVRQGAKDGAKDGTKQGTAEVVIAKNQQSGQRNKTNRRGGRG